MPVARKTKRRTRLERNAVEIMGALLDGADQVDIARRYKVSESAVSQFVTRHAEEYKDMELAVAKGVEDFFIANKINRVGVRDMLHAGLLAVKQARAKGKTGAETGLVVREYKMIGSGDSAMMVEEWKLDKSLLEMIDRLERSTAEELGQLPRPDQNVNVRAQLLIRDISGTDVDVS